LAIILAAAMAAGAASAAAGSPFACPPTEERENGPFYRPDAPVRTSVGSGYLLRGMVRSAATCRPVPGARLEFWLAGPEGYIDRYRATLFAAQDGGYRFSSPFPRDYGGRPHIHIRVTAPGFQELFTHHYPQHGTGHGTFDLTLSPAPRQETPTNR
jgi:protocatechuate 3,4-dioxygenase beta subunit